MDAPQPLTPLDPQPRWTATAKTMPPLTLEQLLDHMQAESDRLRREPYRRHPNFFYL